MAERTGTSRIRSNKGKSVGAPRRFWTGKEEEALMDFMEMLTDEGWKADGSFRGGYMKRLATMLEEKLPGCGLTETQVKSKLSVWKKTHKALLQVLSSSGEAGFSMDPNTYMLMNENDTAWAEYKRCNPESVKLIRGKPMPFFPRWNVIFGLDHATGVNSVDVADAINGLSNGGTNDSPSQYSNGTFPNSSNGDELNGDDEATSASPPKNGSAKRVGSSATKRKSNCMDDPNEIKSMMGSWMAEHRSAIDDVAKKLFTGNPSPPAQIPVDVSQRGGIFAALDIIQSLELDDKVILSQHFARNSGELEVFWGMTDTARERYAHLLLNGILKG